MFHSFISLAIPWEYASDKKLPKKSRTFIDWPLSAWEFELSWRTFNVDAITDLVINSRPSAAAENTKTKPKSCEIADFYLVRVTSSFDDQSKVWNSWGLVDYLIQWSSTGLLYSYQKYTPPNGLLLVKNSTRVLIVSLKELWQLKAPENNKFSAVYRILQWHGYKPIPTSPFVSRTQCWYGRLAYFLPFSPLSTSTYEARAATATFHGVFSTSPNSWRYSCWFVWHSLIWQWSWACGPMKPSPRSSTTSRSGRCQLRLQPS